MKRKTKIRLLQAGSFISSLAPLGVVVGINFTEYVKTTASAVSLTVGGALAVIFALLSIYDKAKLPRKRIWVFAFIFGLAWALEPLIVDLKLLSGAALGGEILNTAFFEAPIKRNKRLLEAEEVAEVQAKAHKKVETMEVSGRV